jgi:hypothetical protein
MVIALAILHVAAVSNQQTIDHAARSLQILRMPRQHLIPEGSETVDPSWRAPRLLLVPRGRDPALFLHVAQSPIHHASIWVLQAVSLELLLKHITMGGPMVKQQKQRGLQHPQSAAGLSPPMSGPASLSQISPSLLWLPEEQACTTHSIADYMHFVNSMNTYRWAAYIIGQADRG